MYFRRYVTVDDGFVGTGNEERTHHARFYALMPCWIQVFSIEPPRQVLAAQE